MVQKNAFMQTRKAARVKVAFGKAQPIQFPEPPHIVLGQPAGSKEEWYTSQALERLGWQYAFQYQVMGGRSVRGGQVIDFLVYTPGKWTIVDVLGTYWHTGKHEDRLSIQKVVAQKGWRLIEAWDYNVPSIDEAVSFLRARLGAG